MFPFFENNHFYGSRLNDKKSDAQYIYMPILAILDYLIKKKNKKFITFLLLVLEHYYSNMSHIEFMYICMFLLLTIQLLQFINFHIFSIYLCAFYLLLYNLMIQLGILQKYM